MGGRDVFGCDARIWVLARKIQAELSELGIRVSLTTVSRYLPKIKPRIVRISGSSTSDNS